MNPRWPVFIPSKGRAERRLTAEMFDRLGVPYLMFVEPQEAELYARYVPVTSLFVLPHRDRGLAVTRNFIWDYAAEHGYDYYWTFDDNIRGLYRFNRNLKTPCADATIMAVIEEFASRYENLPLCGMNYFMFVSRKSIATPFRTNTRVYSNMLIQTRAVDERGNPFRFVTFYNDDTDLCLRILKSGLVIVLFNAFLIEKQTTMTVPGGMTDFYKQTNNRREFVEELIAAHPDVVKLTQKWGRWHHQVDYSGFTQRLRRRPGVELRDGVDNFGMVLEERGTDGAWRATG